jgi:very-short-patch-repair endonuclease
MATADHRLIELAKAQYGAVSRVQAHGVGLTDHQLRARVRSGGLEQIGPNAFRLAGSDTSMIARLAGVLLDIGEPVWAAGPTAAALHRLDGFDLCEPFHVVTTRARRIRRVGVVVHQAQHLPPHDVGEIARLPIVKPTRTIIDLARMVDRATLTRAVDAAIRDRLTSEEALLRRIAKLEGRGHGRLGTDQLLAVLEGVEIERGAQSYLERAFLQLLAGHGLPRPDTQVVLGRAGDSLVRVDCRFPGTNVVVELLGYRFHRTPAQLSRDAERMNELLARGFRPYQFSYRHITEEPAVVIATLRRALHVAA